MFYSFLMFYFYLLLNKHFRMVRMVLIAINPGANIRRKDESHK